MGAYFYLFAMQGETIINNGIYIPLDCATQSPRGCCCPFFRVSDVVFVFYRLLVTLFFSIYDRIFQLF